MSNPAGPEERFVLSVPDAELEFLRKKLDLVRFPDELDGAGWNYGVPLPHMKRLVEYWREGFNWRKAEAKINEIPMFTRNIAVEGHGTLNIHYIHQKSEVENAIPLLFVHGWPGNFLEVRKLLPLLTTRSPDCPSFNVVAVGLPGFGWSEGSKKPGFKGPQYAELCNKLMLSLGYLEYAKEEIGVIWYLKDFDSHCVRYSIENPQLNLFTANIYGHKHVKAWHTNFPITSMAVPDWRTHPRVLLTLLARPFSTTIQKMLEHSQKFVTTGTAYWLEQATKPQTLAYSLADSPVGLLAWIYEKLHAWTDNYPWTDDEILEWISIYWFSRSGPGASLRIYNELSNGNTRDVFEGTKWSTVPIGASYFPREIVTYPPSWTTALGNVVSRAEHDKGGHFAAFEVPESLAGDLQGMFGKGGPAYGIVPGKDGY